ncbi:mitochondrial import inner membrane translocase subunit Tim21 [Gouania willdenowi]|uniref:Mitochondrial import inner membrane translocase subunit Tim21 n=1 Tax=Gouania willdenowi TaxID=441366 RepID=A0A8C5GRA5_GOUWI|nr:mitochondrial import inner membrane translocase subunit Tim21 [Gouania willdenowi]
MFSCRMFYAHVSKVVQRNVLFRLPQVSPFIQPHRAVFLTPSPAYSGTRADTAPPFLCGFTQIHGRRGFSLCLTNRNKINSEDKDKAVFRYQTGSPKPSAAQKVKEAGRDFTYLIVVLVGFGVTGALLYVVFQELFSSSSPNKVYGKAFEKVRSHPEVIGAFGEPLKCYGETTRRGRRQQVSHMEYMKDGMKHMRLKFYIEGSEPGLKGTVHSESKENPESGKYEFRYIIINMDTYPRRTIVVEDNRYQDNQSAETSFH